MALWILIKQKKVFLIDVLHIFILFSLAFSKPLYVLSRNAEFFVAHNSKPIDIILFILKINSADISEVRFFAMSKKGVASELHYYKKYKYSKKS